MMCATELPEWPMFIGRFGILGIRGALFPLTGLSLLAMIVLDRIWQSSTNRAVKHRWLDSLTASGWQKVARCQDQIIRVRQA